MLRTITIATALVLAMSGLVFAQTNSAPSTSTPTTSSSAGNATSGTSTMSESQIKEQLKKDGYSDVELKEDTTSNQMGDWTGTAMHSGKEVKIHVDSTGKVTQR